MAGERTRERGELEGEVLRILWAAAQPLGARDIQARFTGHIPAYTTLMTALERLQNKGDVVRVDDGTRRVRFQAARSGDEHVGRSMLTALSRAEDRRAALLQFAGNLDEHDLDLLRCALSQGRQGNSAKRR